MSLYAELEKSSEVQVGGGVSNIGSVLQPALDTFREGLLEISGSVLRQIRAQKGAGVKRKTNKNKSKKQKGSGVIKKKKKSGNKQQRGGGKPRITKKKPRNTSKKPRAQVRTPNF